MEEYPKPYGEQINRRLRLNAERIAPYLKDIIKLAGAAFQVGGADAIWDGDVLYADSDEVFEAVEAYVTAVELMYGKDAIDLSNERERLLVTLAFASGRAFAEFENAGRPTTITPNKSEQAESAISASLAKAAADRRERQRLAGIMDEFVSRYPGERAYTVAGLVLEQYEDAEENKLTCTARHLVNSHKDFGQISIEKASND